jgi:hypothetical protein
MSTKDPGVEPENEDDGKSKEIISYWRHFPADAFDDTMQENVALILKDISSTSSEWRDALGGDAAAATGLALRLAPASRITLSIDMTMTVLLHAAFQNAGAAAVMSHMLQKMPLQEVDRMNLSTSWQMHKVWLKSRRGLAQ